jgi:hypothetical protein
MTPHQPCNLCLHLSLIICSLRGAEAALVHTIVDIRVDLHTNIKDIFFNKITGKMWAKQTCMQAL